MQRVAIVGTAPSWRLTPWNDPGLRILGLNDAYQLRWPRADEWYDLHPMDKFYYTPGRKVFAHEVPAGWYVRPEGHVEWLRQQAIPVWLQSAPPDGWLHARAFPWEDIRATFGQYFQSSPALMLAHAILRGAKEIHIYGIHLATEHEYIEQRPNFEYLIGRALGAGKIRESKHQGCITYETEDARIVMPEASPLLRSNFRYALEPRPAATLEPLKWELHKLQIKHARVVQALKTRKWWQPASSTQAQLWYLEAALDDAHQQLRRAQMAIGG
jgi:hypothetical protein